MVSIQRPMVKTTLLQIQLERGMYYRKLGENFVSATASYPVTKGKICYKFWLKLSLDYEENGLDEYVMGVRKAFLFSELLRHFGRQRVVST